MSRADVEPFEIAGCRVRPGKREHLEVPVANLATGDPLALAVSVLHGRRPGRKVWLAAAIHGDELNGVEIIRRVLERLDPRELAGTLIAVPIVNVFGFIHQSRYLPDRRDLNRSFPGSPRGSLAARLAHLFLREVVARCSHGIDLHTGSNHRANLPQIRADLDDRETRRIARAFGAPALLHSRLRDGSLREAAKRMGSHVLVYEAGEAQRFDREAIEVGERGVLAVLAKLGLAQESAPELPRAAGAPSEPFEARSSRWVRARRAGILHLDARLGDAVSAGVRLGVITDPLGRHRLAVRAPADGLLIGLATNPLVHRGDAIAHLALR